MKFLQVLAGGALLWALTPAFSASAADGKAVYTEHCQGCHGADGKGDTPVGKILKVPSLVGPHSASLAMIETTIKKGAGHMPKLGDQLSADEITAVAKYTQEMMTGK